MEDNEIIVQVNHLPLLMYLLLWRGPFLRGKAAGEYIQTHTLSEVKYCTKSSLPPLPLYTD
jgi:hypothetical protein